MKKRHVILILLVFVIAQSFIRVLTPVRPIIQLPGEIVFARGLPVLGGITNTFIASLVAFVLVMLVAFFARRGMTPANEVPSGFYNFFEMLMEMSYNYVENNVGPWAKKVFPFFMTFILWIVIGNWMELVPGVDSIGKFETMGEYRGHLAEAELKTELRPQLAAGEITQEEYDEAIHAVYEEVKKETDAGAEGDLRQGIFLVRAPVDADGEKPAEADYALVPYLRAPATDLSYTLALAIISVVMTQVYGMQAKGMRYWSKFFVWNGDKIAQSPIAIMDTGVGILEFISEVAKIISFAFRLLGNIFAGMVLLFVIGSLLPVANVLFWHLEFAIILLQGAVFALLTMTFMKNAVEDSHH